MLTRIKDILHLVRWSNLLFLAALIYLMEKWVAVPILNNAAFGEQLPGYILVLLMFATVLIAAGGYVINDYFDVKIDRINRPEDLIVTRSVSKPEAVGSAVTQCHHRDDFYPHARIAVVLFQQLQAPFHDRKSHNCTLGGTDADDGSDSQHGAAAASLCGPLALHNAGARPLCVAWRLCALRFFAHLGARDSEGRAGPNGRSGVRVPLHACGVGGPMDENIRHSAYRADNSGHRSSMVSCVAVPRRVELSEHTLYRFRSPCSSHWCYVAFMGGEDTE